MFGKNSFDIISNLFDESVFWSKEYIILPNFLIIGKDVFQPTDDSIIFISYKIYGYSNTRNSYSLKLFDAQDRLMVGTWQKNLLALYRDASWGYLRLYFLAKRIKKYSITDISNITPQEPNSLNYYFFIDKSDDGIIWQRCGWQKYDYFFN